MSSLMHSNNYYILNYLSLYFYYCISEYLEQKELEFIMH